jgi:hypothetical protein
MRRKDRRDRGSEGAGRPRGHSDEIGILLGWLECSQAVRQLLR